VKGPLRSGRRVAPGPAAVAGWTLALLALVPAGRCAIAAAPAVVTIESRTQSLARLDSLQAIVREEEARVRPSPGVEGGWTRLARAWFQVGDQAKAAKCLERARSVGGREFDTALLSGRVARSEGRLAEALEWLQRATQMRPDDWEAREDLGLAFYLDGQDARAADQWERSRALPGSGSPDRTGLIDALRRVGERPYQMSGRGRERLRLVAQPMRGPLVVSIRVNGRAPCLFRIDAGSPEVVLHESLARELGLAIFPGSRKPSPPTPGVALDYAVVDSLTLGSTTLHRMPVAVTSDPRLAGAGAPRGLLGFEALRRFRFCIDVGDSTLWLDPPGSASAADTSRPEWAPAGARVHRVPVVLRGTHLLIATGQVNQGPPRPFLIDAGGTGVAFSAPISTLAEAGIAPDSTRVLTGTSTAGSVHFIAFPVARLCVGDACLDSLEGAYGTFPPRLELNPNFRLAGIVSGGFLTHYRIGVDAARREVWLVEP
jgi:Aspartyl protease/TPR repeat